MRIVSEDAYVSLDYAKRDGVVIRKSDNAKALDGLRRQLASGSDLANLDYSDLVHIDQLTMSPPDDDPSQDPLTAQLTSFIRVVRSGQNPTVDAAAGYAAVDAAERVIGAIARHKWEGLTSINTMSRSWIIMSITTPISRDRNVIGLTRSTSMKRGWIPIAVTACTAGLNRSV